MFYNGKRALIVCTLSALLEEAEKVRSAGEIKERLFNRNSFKFDMEHIYAKDIFEKHPEYISPGNTDPEYIKECIREYNGIGNLVVLNRSINRRIGNKAPDEKAAEMHKN